MINMATLLLKAFHKEQLSVIRFLWAEGLCPNAIHSEMCPLYGDKCSTRPAIHIWSNKFPRRRESAVDVKRSG